MQRCGLPSKPRSGAAAWRVPLPRAPPSTVRGTGCLLHRLSIIRQVREDLETRRDLFNEYVADEDNLPGIETRAGDWECNYCPLYDKFCFHELEAAGVQVKRFN